jgi:hypothetical protein
MATIWRAYTELLSLEYPLFRQDFAAIYEKVRKTRVRIPARTKSTAEEICHAVDLAAALYFKHTRCLQMSAAAARLLKKSGFSAEMVVGVQQIPFLAHAWVALDGRVVNDKPYMPEIYLVLSRC